MELAPIQWQNANAVPPLKAGEVHVWRFQLPVADKVGNHLGSLLSSAETERSKRFHFEQDRIRFSRFRGFLRLLLGHYLGTDPSDIEFHENPQGKPQLAPPVRNRHFYFNLAHSRDTALFAFSPQGPLGVDLEKIQEPFDGEKIAARYFSPEEISYLALLPPGEKSLGFFRLWTLKEAYLKALGLGFKGGLDTFSVSLDQEGKAGLTKKLPEDPGLDWLLQYFRVEADGVGALAVAAPSGTLRFLDGNSLLTPPSK